MYRFTRKTLTSMSGLLTAYLVLVLVPVMAMGEQVIHTYDDLNRLIRTDYGNGQVVEYTYDAAGNRLTQIVTVQPSPMASPSSSPSPTVGPGPASNLAPTANAGSDQSGLVGSPVTLDGSASVDPDNGPSPLSFSWTQTGGAAVSLTNAKAATPSFTPTSAGRYAFSLVVSDDDKMSAPDSVNVLVNSKPTFQLLEPNGGETYQARKSMTIRWIASDFGPRQKLQIKWSKNGGKKWQLIKTVNNKGRAIWKPGIKYVSNQALLLLCVPKTKPKLCDASDGTFAITR